MSCRMFTNLTPPLTNLPLLNHFPSTFSKVKSRIFSVRWKYIVTVQRFKNAGKWSKRCKLDRDVSTFYLTSCMLHQLSNTANPAMVDEVCCLVGRIKVLKIFEIVFLKFLNISEIKKSFAIHIFIIEIYLCLPM